MSTPSDSKSTAPIPSESRPIAASKPIPLEDPETAAAKGWVIASFWAVVVLLGLPIWLWTTSIHRASLPTGDMLKWADGKTCQVEFPLQFSIDAPELSKSHLNAVVEAAHATAKDQFHVYRPRLVPHSSVKSQDGGENQSVLEIKLQEVQGLSGPIAELVPNSRTVEVLYDGSLLKQKSDTTTSAIGSAIVQELHRVFAEEQSLIQHILASSSGSYSTPELESTTNQAKRRSRALKYAPDVHISVSLFTPGSVPTTWDIDAAVKEYLEPLLNSFPVSNFTIDTQLQLYAPFSPSMKPPELHFEKNHWIVREEDLSSFINPTDWPLSPSIGDGPTVNFIIYIPEESQRPLVIKDSNAHSWVVPQWGGVSILNPPGPVPDHLTKEYLQSPLLTFSHQLLSLLGAPETPASFPLQMQSLTRIHALSLVLSASSTLGSLARLSESLATIPIPEEVLLRVQRSMDHLQSTCNELQAGNSRQALDHARQAEAEAEKAFFEKDMVSQVYFPDEHKVAVYLPLLGPVGVPLLTSLIREVRRRRALRK